jgi:hypothetical protein
LVGQGYVRLDAKILFLRMLTMNEETTRVESVTVDGIGNNERCDRANEPRDECAPRPEIRAALEPTCCGSDCADCPF